MIKLSVTNGKLAIRKNETNTTNAINYYKIHFDFDSSWDNLTKHATFFQNINGDIYDIEIPENNIVNVPKAVLINPSIPYNVGVYGIGQDQRATTNNVKIEVVQGSFHPDMITPEAFVASGFPIIVEQANEMQQILDNATPESYGKIYFYVGETTVDFEQNSYYLLKE